MLKGIKELKRRVSSGLCPVVSSINEDRKPMRNNLQINSLPEDQDPLSGVSAALELLVEEMRIVLRRVYRIEEQMRRGQSDGQSGRVVQLQPQHRRSFGRTPQGVKTAVEAFYKPILEALIAGGGELAKTQVLNSVESAMHGALNKEDLGRNRSNNIPRWHSTADHARQKMVTSGYLEAGTRKGIWKITAEGRKWLGQAA